MEAHATAWGYDKFNTPWVMYPFLVGKLMWRQGFSLHNGEILLLGVGTHFAGDFGRWVSLMMQWDLLWWRLDFGCCIGLLHIWASPASPRLVFVFM